MCVVGKDPNDEYFPFAYAVVEAETKDPWTCWVQGLMDLVFEFIICWLCTALLHTFDI